MRVAKRSERHPPEAVGVRLGRLGRRLDRKPGLSGTARAAQRQEPQVLSLQELHDRCKLELPPDHRRRGHRQVRPIEALERRELVLAELEDALGGAEILEAVLSQVAQRQRLWL